MGLDWLRLAWIDLQEAKAAHNQDTVDCMWLDLNYTLRNRREIGEGDEDEVQRCGVSALWEGGEVPSGKTKWALG